MPNWCWNHAEIVGDKEELDRFWQDVTAIGGETDDSGEFHPKTPVLEHFMPLPDWATETRTGPNGETYGVFAEGGYEEACRLWGTKWPDGESRLKREENCVTWFFTSPWGSPNEGIGRLSKLYPTLVFGLCCEEEQGMFWGYVVRNGEWHGETPTYDWNSPDYPEQPENSDDEDDFFDKLSEWESEQRGKVDDWLDERRLEVLGSSEAGEPMNLNALAEALANFETALGAFR